MVVSDLGWNIGGRSDKHVCNPVRSEVQSITTSDLTNNSEISFL